MTHPVHYFIESPTTHTLVEQYGSYLEKLDRCQLLQARVLLTSFLMGQDMMGCDYSISDAWCDSNLHVITTDEKVVAVADILTDLTISEAEGLLTALHEQCTVGHARIKNPTETMTETLLSYGMPLEFASAAAVIFKQVDGTRDRTPDEQSVINEMYKFLGTSIKERREAETAK